MHMLKFLVYLMIGIFLTSMADAAIIHGTVYDFYLKKVNNARVEINTSSKQFFVAQNGSYSFDVPNGAYAIKAQLIQKNSVIASVQENITIKQEGTYVLDLILFPNFEEGVEDLNIDLNNNVIDTKDNKAMLITIFLVIILILFAIGFYFYKKKRGIKHETKMAEEPKEEEKDDDNELEQLISIIKKEGGRTTQKEIRKQIPLSEAKISLMIAELEHKGTIKKIKKGRGNIIILKKK